MDGQTDFLGLLIGVWADRYPSRKMDGLVDRWMNVWMQGCIGVDWTVGWMSGWSGV